LFTKSPDCNFCIRAFLCLSIFLSTATSNAAQPFLTQDQNPFSLIHGQPQPVAAQLPETGSSQWSLSLDISNTLNTESNSTENLFVDYEAYNLRFALLHSLDENWALKVDIPLIYYGEGFLDNTIDSWHDFFGLPRADRPNVADNQFQILYEQNGQTLIDLNTAESGLGDIQLALGRNIIQQQYSTLSLWASIDLPTGDQSSLTGNDSSDLSLWLAGDYRFHPGWSVDTNIGILFPGESQISKLAVEDQVIFAYAGIQWQAHEIFDLRIQFNGHSSFYSDSQLKLLGAAHNIVFGGSIHVSNCSDFDIAVSEDIQVGATPDVSFLFNWKSRFDCQ